MFEHRDDWIRKYTQGDLLASTLRSALSLTGPVGVIVAEFLTQFVPDQRIDRLHDFVERLGERMIGLEPNLKRA